MCAVLTLRFDVVLDICFLLDILVQFNSAVRVEGEYIDDRKKVAWVYLKGGFWFDAITSFPVSFFELAGEMACAKDASLNLESGQLKFIRAMKPLRWLKLARILKLCKASRKFDAVMDTLGLTPQFISTSRTYMVLALTLHLLACFWFLWKALGMTLEEMNASLDSEMWGRYPRHELHTTQGKIEAYVLSMYLVAMTITTVGYGDITADNTSERVGYTVFFIVCAFFLG